MTLELNAPPYTLKAGNGREIVYDNLEDYLQRFTVPSGSFRILPIDVLFEYIGATNLHRSLLDHSNLIEHKLNTHLRAYQATVTKEGKTGYGYYVFSLSPSPDYVGDNADVLDL
jgi:hypothetical protein